MRTHATSVVLMPLLLLSACQDSNLIDPNSYPKAVAWVSKPDAPFPDGLDGGGHFGARTLDVEYTGKPVSITLDASRSSDPDGKIVEYRWLSGDLGEGCMGRAGTDPADKVNPKVELDEGFHRFVLFVRDNRSAWSDPTNLVIRIGDAEDPCPEGPDTGEGSGDDGGVDLNPSDLLPCVMECAADRCAPEADACDGNPDCWPLLGCVAEACLDADPADVTMCAITEGTTTCAEFLGGQAEGIAAAQCAIDCATMECIE